MQVLTEQGSQIFVANPKKPPQIESILRRNKDKLVGFLQHFQNDKDGMSAFCMHNHSRGHITNCAARLSVQTNNSMYARKVTATLTQDTG